MAKCKCCHLKGFAVETDVNGLCSACAPYYYLTLPQDLEDLLIALKALNRLGKPEAAQNRIDKARDCLNRLRPYAWAGLVHLPKMPAELDQFLDRQAELWNTE